MKIALIGHKPAYPKIDGGCVASAAFLGNLLDAGYEVTYAMLSTSKHPYNEKAFPEAIRDKATLSATPIRTKINVFKAFAQLFSTKSYNVERFYSQKFESNLRSILTADNYDAVIFDNVFSARYTHIAKEMKIPCYVRTHNVEFKIWEGLSHNTDNVLKKWYFKKLTADLKRFELSILNKVDGLFSIAKEDLEVFQDYGINTQAIHVPVSLQSPDYTHNYTQASLFHIGAMNWKPNIEAVDRILHLLPTMRKRSPETTFTIGGRGASVHYENQEEKGIIVQDDIHSVSEFAKSQGVLVSPISSGSGVRIKILEMMALGVPVITTTLGAQGIEDTSGLIIADSDENLLDAIYELTTDENKRKNLGEHAKTVVSLYHNPTKISAQIIEFLSNK